MELNSREVAVLVWFFLAVLWFLFIAKKKNISYGLMNVVKAFFCKPILIIISASALWVSVCVLLLSQLGAWSLDNLKTTIIWFVGTAFIAMMNSSNNQGETESEYVGRYLKEMFGLSVLVVFLAESYTLPLYLELLLFPVLFFFSAIMVIAKRKPEHQLVGRISEWVISIVAFTFILYSLANILLAPAEFFSWEKLSDFFLPAILSIGFFPFIMFLRVVMVYEICFNKISRWMKDSELRRYAKRRAIITFGIDIDALTLWSDRLSHQKMNIVAKQDIDDSLAGTLKSKIDEKLRLSVPAEKGWNPYDAKDFLKNEGLVCGHYRAIYEGWGAESNFFKINNRQHSTISYYVTGEEESVQSLRLKLFVWKGEGIENAEHIFARLCVLLTTKAVPDITEDQLVRICDLKEINFVERYWRFEMRREIFENRFAASYELVFEIEMC